jgi:hypothetical protein
LHWDAGTQPVKQLPSAVTAGTSPVGQFGGRAGQITFELSQLNPATQRPAIHATALA